jgi:hypothetical protein
MCGTLHVSRKDVPKTIRDRKLKKGQLTAQNSCIMSMLKCSDKKASDKISNHHGEQTRKKLTKHRQYIWYRLYLLKSGVKVQGNHTNNKNMP